MNACCTLCSVLPLARPSSVTTFCEAFTADTGTLEYNTADGTLWFLHAVGRHVERTGDLDLAAGLADDLAGVVDAHVAGTQGERKLTVGAREFGGYRFSPADVCILVATDERDAMPQAIIDR